MEEIHAENWLYTNPFAPEKNTILITSHPNKITLNNHRRFDWHTCKDDQYICLLSGGMSFVFPKKLANEKQWSNHDITYSILGKEELTLLGTKVPNVFIISASYKGEKYQYFLYSVKKGIIAISGPSKELPYVLIYEGRCGFGASIDCK